MTKSERDRPVIEDPNIRLSTTQREMADPASDDIFAKGWHPDNRPAEKLWRCLEALRDVNNLLAGTDSVSDESELKRRLKLLAAPLLSFFDGIRALCRYLSSDPGTARELSEGQRQHLLKALEYLDGNLPLAQGSPLRDIRDKLAAHVDERLLPTSAREMMSQAVPGDYGRWLHQAILILLDVVKIGVYSWSSDDCPPDCAKIMTNEPFAFTWRIADGNQKTLVRMEIVPSPRNSINAAAALAVARTQWMFGSDEIRIHSLAEEQSVPAETNQLEGDMNDRVHR